MTQRELIQSALRKLGPERCQQALVAFHTERDGLNPWENCFLARAYGECGELMAQFVDASGYGLRLPVQAAALLGLTVEECNAVWRSFDGWCPASISPIELRAMVKAEAAKARVTKRETVTV
jgi:hypothetical protein